MLKLLSLRHFCYEMAIKCQAFDTYGGCHFHEKYRENKLLATSSKEKRGTKYEREGYSERKERAKCQKSIEAV